MARGALRGVASGALSLIVLQGLVSRGGSGRVAGLLADVDRLVTRVLDPAVPAIPDHSTGAAGATGARTKTGVPGTAKPVVLPPAASTQRPTTGSWIPSL